MKTIERLAIILFLVFYSVKSSAQCELLDGNGIATANPVWTGCSQVTSALDTTFLTNVIPANNFGPYTIDWGDGTIESGPSLNPPASLIHTYTAVTGGGTVFADTFFITFTSGACVINGVVISGYPVTANIGVPGGLASLTCAPGVLQFENNSNGASNLPIMPSTVFTWDFGDGTPPLVFGADNVGDTISHTYQRNTVSCLTQVDLTADNECNLAPSINSQSPVAIYDLDTAIINASATILCYPDTVVDFTNGSLLNCVPEGNTEQRYALWNFGDYWGQGQDSIVGWRRSRIPIQDPPNPLTIAYPGIGTYNVTMIDSNQCGQEPTSIIIQIIAPPTAAFAISDDTICAGEQVTFFNNTVGANRFSWDFGEGGGFVRVGGGNQTRTYNNPGTFTITLAISIAGSNCRDTAQLDLVVQPSPVADINLDNQVGCDSLTVNFSDNSSGTPPPIIWNWDFGNTNTSMAQDPGTQFYPSPNNYNVSLTVENNVGCTDTDTEVINVYETPIPSFTPTSVCAGQLTNFMNTSTSAAGDPIVSWVWDFGDGSGGSILEHPSHVFMTAGTFDVILEVATANCLNRDTFPVVVEELPTANFTKTVISGCSPLSVNFTNTSSANTNTVFWDFGDGDTTSITNPNHVFINNTANDITFTITMIAKTTFGCPDTITQTIDVFPNPQASFINNAVLDCGPLYVDFTNTSSANAISYRWNFGDGDTSILENPTDTFENMTPFIQVYTVELIATSANGCSDTAYNNITVYPEPQFSFLQVPDTGCSPMQVTFPPVIGAVVYNWDFGDGTFGTGPTPTHTYTNITNKDTTYTVQLIAQSPFGCTDTAYGSVVVFPNPSAQFIVDRNLGCPILPVTFTNTSSGADTYHWDFDDGVTIDTTDLVVTHNFDNATPSQVMYNVKLVATSSLGCADSTVSTITVDPAVVADFDADTAGCSVLEIQFANQSTPSATIFAWDFGEGGGSTQKDPIYAYINNGSVPLNYTVTLIARSPLGCSDTVTSPVTVYPAPQADFQVLPNRKTFPDTSFVFENITNGGTDWQYKWDFGDGDSSLNYGPNITHGYGVRQPGKDYVSGEFEVLLIAKNDFCADTISKTVTIDPPLPVVEFNTDSGCAPLTVQFENNSKYGIQYLWDFDDGFTSTEKNPKHLFLSHGNYAVELKVFGEAGDVSEQRIVNVYESPQAAFFVQPTRVFIPGNPVVAFNSSVGENLVFNWDFGDGSTSNVKDPQHFYKAEGSYTITLIVDNGLCPDTLVRRSAVMAIPGGSIRTPNAFTPNPGGPSNGGRYDPTATNNDIFFPLVENAVEIEFSVFNKWGELLFVSNDPQVGWDGYYRGELSPQDVYVWKVKAKLIDETEVIQVGDLTLIR